MKSYVANAFIGDMITGIQFDAANDLHADRIAQRHGWELLGELVFETFCDDITEALIQQGRETLH